MSDYSLDTAVLLSAIIESSDNAIVSKDLNGIVQSWNRAAERMFGYTADEMVGQSILKIIPEDRLKEEERVLTSIRAGERVDHFEPVRKTRTGSLLPISLTVSPIRDSSGRVVGASKIARDISDRKRAEALAVENARSYEEARTANRLKDEFLATLSHELRTPLNAVLGYARMLRSSAVPPERMANAIEVVERNAVALAQIVEDVLDVSRIISGKARLEVQATDICKVVEDAIATVMLTAEAKGISVERAIDARVGVINGDPNRLRQVIWNLLSNAVKFTPRAGRIEIRLERMDGHLEIAVSDTGIGFSPEFRPHLFERFRQAEGGTARRHGGLGLGLAIARHIVEMHGGTIEAASEGEGRGSTFRVQLPANIPVSAR